MDNIQEFLSRDIILGNAPLDWFRAGTTFGIIFLFLLFLKIVGSSRYKVLKAEQDLIKQTKLKIGFVIFSFLRKINMFVAIFIAAYPGLYNLTLPVKIAKLSRKVFIVFVFIQILIWVVNAINLYSKNYVYQRIQKDPTSVTAANVFTLIGKIFATTIVLLLMLDQLGFNITALLAGLGVGGIAIALAMQNILGDLFASLTIVFDKPFKVGDTLFLNNIWGTIERVGLKNTRLRSLDGNLLIVPNSYLLQNQIQNYSELSERRTLVKIGVVYETSFEKLNAIPGIAQKIVEELKNNRFEHMIFHSYGDSALIFELSYYTRSMNEKRLVDVRHAINMNLFKAFNENGIEFAYPTQTLYINNLKPIAENR